MCVCVRLVPKWASSMSIYQAEPHRDCDACGQLEVSIEGAVLHRGRVGRRRRVAHGAESHAATRIHGGDDGPAVGRLDDETGQQRGVGVRGGRGRQPATVEIQLSVLRSGYIWRP